MVLKVKSFNLSVYTKWRLIFESLSKPSNIQNSLCYNNDQPQDLTTKKRVFEQDKSNYLNFPLFLKETKNNNIKRPQGKSIQNAKKISKRKPATKSSKVSFI